LVLETDFFQHLQLLSQGFNHCRNLWRPVSVILWIIVILEFVVMDYIDWTRFFSPRPTTVFLEAGSRNFLSKQCHQIYVFFQSQNLHEILICANLVSAIVSFYEANKAVKVVEATSNPLPPTTIAKQDGVWDHHPGL